MQRSIIVLIAGGLGVLGSGFLHSQTPEEAMGMSGAVYQETYQTRRLNTLTVWPWDISPDARYVTIIDWGTGDLALMDLGTGEVERVTDKGTWDESDAWAGGGKFSPDGQKIAYSFVSEACLDQANAEGNASDALHMEIRVIDRTGDDEPRIVLPCTPWQFGALFPADWSPDGKTVLLGLPGPDDSARFATLDMADGTLTELGTVPDGGAIRFARFSPDGLHIVYSAPSGTETGWDVFYLPVEGGLPRPMIARPGRDQVLGWEDNGRSVLFQTEDGLSSGVFRVPVRGNVVPAGDPEMVRSGLWRAGYLGDTRDGFAYLTTVGQAQVHTATLDLGRRRITSPLAAVEDPSMGASGSPAWSPDGRWLAYVRKPIGDGEFRLVIRGVEGGETRELPMPLSGDPTIWWKPGSTSLLALGTHEDLGQGLFDISLISGETTPVLTDDEGWLGRASTATVSADAGTFVIARSGETRDRVTAYDLTEGRSWEIPAESGIPDRLFVITAELSPDGETLAYEAGNDPGEDVWVIPVRGGAPRMVFRGGTAESVPRGVPRALAWTPDGSELLAVVTDFASLRPRCREEDGDCRRARLVRISVDGTGIEDLMDAPFSGLRIHPDGSWIAFTKGGWAGEVWVMNTGN